MALSDKLLGSGLLLVASVVFTYYTFWTLITPFLPVDHPAQEYFPSREWAIRIPAFILVLGISAVGAFMGSVLLKESRKRKAKLANKAA
ncbi:hypothetical protein FRC03_001543 [Tulasnella sp. 419]|nr:hypothetical protein FRC03_001543 [Tulasnella sp. 419]